MEENSKSLNNSKDSQSNKDMTFKASPIGNDLNLGGVDTTNMDIDLQPSYNYEDHFGASAGRRRNSSITSSDGDLLTNNLEGKSDGDHPSDGNRNIEAISNFYPNGIQQSSNYASTSRSDDHEDQRDNNDRHDGAATMDQSRDQERKILLLMLLAQVCALHDSTPKTFTVHVLDLYRRGILGYESIGFMFDMGLLPTLSPPSSPSSGDGREREKTLEKDIHPNIAHESNASLFQSHRIEDNERDIKGGDEGASGKTEQIQSKTIDENLPNAIIPYQKTGVSSSKFKCERIQKLSQLAINRPQASDQDREKEVQAIFQFLEQQEQEELLSKRKKNDHINKLDGAILDSRGQNSIPHPPYSRGASSSTQSSWSVEHHPLSLSRYSRDFVQKKLLAAGSFGQVFSAMNKLDNSEYAIKRVAFSAQGYDTQHVDFVIREVQCLAKLQHENVVRYYQSWLEPSWMPGSAATQLIDDIDKDSYGAEDSDGISDTSPKIEHKRLLIDIERLVLNDGDNDNVIQSIEQQILFDEQSRDKKFDAGAGLSAWSFEGSASGVDDDWNQLAVHQSSRGAYDSNSISTGGYGAEDSEYSEWTVDQSDTRNRPWNFSKNSSRRPHQSSNRKDPNLGKRAENGRKWYQICLFIQMELCKPSTLADWIRNRNSTQFHNPSSNLHGRYLMSWKIFRQISKGLAHVHSKHIVHRDLKPANIFHSIEGDFFKIGDFGLSKMLKTANGGLAFESESFSCRENIVVPLKSSIDGSGGWEDPLTMGVGTSSYAAPEQLESERYGAEADVFSLGLILLELFSNFGSEHERASIFHDCRRGKLPPTLSSSSSILQDIGDLILSCTQIQPEKRPTSSSIAQIDIFSSSKVAKMQESLVVGLESKLQKKEKEIQVMAQKLRDSEFTIERQAKELRMLKN